MSTHAWPTAQLSRNENNSMQAEYVTFLSPFEIDRQLYPNENNFCLLFLKGPGLWQDYGFFEDLSL